MNLHHAKNVETQPFISFSFVIFTVHILTYQTTRQFTTSPQCILNKIVEEFLNLVYIFMWTSALMFGFNGELCS